MSMHRAVISQSEGELIKGPVQQAKPAASLPGRELHSKQKEVCQREWSNQKGRQEDRLSSHHCFALR